MSYYGGMYNGAASPLVQRNMANTVRQTASLVSGHQNIREMQSQRWACLPTERIITWTPLHPYKPGSVLQDDQVLWLTIHEASHLELTGSFDFPEPPEIDDKDRFHRFWNCVEDIRIERWAKRQFPGTIDLCRDMHKDWDALMHDAVRRGDEQELHLVDQVGFGYINTELELPQWFSKKAVEFTAKTWAEIDNICTTAKSSAEVAERILPIYQQIMDPPPPGGPGKSPPPPKAQSGAGSPSPEGNASGGNIPDPNATSGQGEKEDQEGGGKPDEKAEEGGGSGGDGEPSENPDEGLYRSTDSEGSPAKLPTLEEILEGMSKDAQGQTKRNLQGKAKEAKQAAAQSGEIAAQGIGKDASGINGSSTDWNNAKNDMRGSINTLSRRMQTRLRHNEMDQVERRLKRGRFDGGNAHRSLRGDMKIFSKKTAIGRADYDFLLTFDCSGSQAPRVREMLKSAVVAAEAIEKAGMGLSMITWDSGMRRFKTWNEPISRISHAIGYDLMHAGGGTTEGYALRVAEDLIRPRLRLGRKVILITLTDGMTSLKEESVAILSDMRRKGVQSIGIGVAHAAPEHYDIRLSVKSGEELANVLPGILKEVVKRG